MHVVIMQSRYRAHRPDTRMNFDNVKKQISHIFFICKLFLTFFFSADADDQGASESVPIFTLPAILLSNVINIYFFDRDFVADIFKIHSWHDIL
jgi:hypothetical protein